MKRKKTKKQLLKIAEKRDSQKSRQVKIKKEPSTIKELHNQIGVVKTKTLSYAGSYVDIYSSEWADYKYFVFFDVSDFKMNIIRWNKVISHCWNFKRKEKYDFGFDIDSNVVYVKNSDYYIVYLRKPNRIYYIDLMKKERSLKNRTTRNRNIPEKEPFNFNVHEK